MTNQLAVDVAEHTKQAALFAEKAQKYAMEAHHSFELAQFAEKHVLRMVSANRFRSLGSRTVPRLSDPQTGSGAASRFRRSENR